MGFTPQQARIALAATDSGVDVQAALDALLAQTVPDTDAPGDEGRQPFADSDDEDTGRRRYDDDDTPAPAPARRPQAAARQESSTRERADAVVPSVQEHADKLLAQASEIGASVFSAANAFWGKGKERVQKAYEERRAAAASVSPAAGAPPKRDMRPKWMQDAEAAERDENDWGLEAPTPASRRADPVDDTAPPKPRARKPEPAPPPPREERSAVVDLFSSDAPAAYVSPNRRRPAPSAAAAPSAPAARAASTSSAASAPRRAPTAPALVERKTVSAPTATLATSAQHKDAGTAAFKLGQYAVAADAYTRALDVLPDGHLARVPLLNNRALARIRGGDYSGALEDAGAAVSIIGADFNPAREKKVEDPSAGAGVDLGDALVKGLRRRAEAAEGRERWADARRDWEALAALGWAPAKVRSEAVSGAGRCRKMEAPAGDDVPKVKPRPKARAPAPKRAASPPGEALQRVQAAARAAEAEDDARHALKDGVDARLLAWKSNKETNVRALLGSLDAVLWPELGMPKVGMHELVTEKQVKVKYTRAIARLHPDKVRGYP
jgi:tetratricopeptide (TPR) repeat protein